MTSGCDGTCRWEHSADSVIADFLSAVDAGRPPDRLTLFGRHPGLAAELGEFFADLDEMSPLLEEFAAALRAAGRGDAPLAPGAGPVPR